MSRLIEYGNSDSDEVMTLDLHDKNVPLVDRVAFVLLMYGECSPSDFLCSEIELDSAIAQL